MKVLIVEDDAAIAEIVQMALEGEGHDVVVASDGRRALDLAAAAQPDLILLDMLMPHMDGWVFAQRYRERPGPHAPIVVMTAAADARRRAQEVRAVAVLGKPFGLQELYDVVAGFSRA